MELDDLRGFVAVAEHCGFRRAASNTGVKQSVLSRRVRKLEDELGVSLLERHRSGARLTRAGRDYLNTTKNALSELQYGARRASQAGRGARGRVRIGIFASIAIGFTRDAIDAFTSRHPDVVIEVSEGAPRDHLLRIRERHLDLAMVTGLTRPDGLASERLWIERVALALPFNHGLADATTVVWDDLADEHFIVSRDEPGPEIHEWLIPRLSSLGRHADIVRCAVARETLLVLVGLGFGLTVVSEAATGVTYPGVTYRFFERDEDLLPFYAVWSRGNDNPALRRFLSLMRAMARGGPLPNSPERAELDRPCGPLRMRDQPP